MQQFQAIVARQDGDKGPVTVKLEQITDADLPEADVLVDVEFSSLNYKDGLCLTGAGGLVRTYPHVAGIDFAGTVES